MEGLYHLDDTLWAVAGCVNMAMETTQTTALTMLPVIVEIGSLSSWFLMIWNLARLEWNIIPPALWATLMWKIILSRCRPLLYWKKFDGKLNLQLLWKRSKMFFSLLPFLELEKLDCQRSFFSGIALILLLPWGCKLMGLFFMFLT